MKVTRRIADGQLNVASGTPGRISLPVQWGRYRLEVSSGERDGPVTSIGFDAGWYTEATADTPDMLELALDKPEYAAGPMWLPRCGVRSIPRRSACPAAPSACSGSASGVRHER
jgi:hypothetical protein